MRTLGGTKNTCTTSECILMKHMQVGACIRACGAATKQRKRFESLVTVLKVEVDVAALRRGSAPSSLS